MNDQDLQALWQEQPRQLPVAFEPGALERRKAPDAAQGEPTAEVELARLDALGETLTRWAVGTAVVFPLASAVVLLATDVAAGAWLLAAGGTTLLGWLMLRRFDVVDARRRVRAAQLLPGQRLAAWPRAPVVALSAVVALVPLLVVPLAERVAGQVTRAKADAPRAAGASRAARPAPVGDPAGRFVLRAWPVALEDTVTAYLSGDASAARAALSAADLEPEVREEFARRLDAAKAATAEADAALAGPSVDLQRAALAARRAIAADEALLFRGQASSGERSMLRSQPSAPGVRLARAMATAAYDRGKQAADAKDFRSACGLWKLGASFTRADVDLLKALLFCDGVARRALGAGAGCADLAFALDVAEDHALRREIEARQVGLECR